jgi:hypothetical protein
MCKASRQHSDGFETMKLFRGPIQFNLLRFIGDDDEHSGEAQDRKLVAGGMKPLAATVRQCEQNVLGLDRLARQSTQERRPLSHVPSLTVLKLVTATPLQQRNPAEIPRISEHFQCRLVGEDKSSLLVNDGKRDAYMV